MFDNARWGLTICRPPGWPSRRAFSCAPGDQPRASLRFATQSIVRQPMLMILKCHFLQMWCVLSHYVFSFALGSCGVNCRRVAMIIGVQSLCMGGDTGSMAILQVRLAIGIQAAANWVRCVHVVRWVGWTLVPRSGITLSNICSGPRRRTPWSTTDSYQARLDRLLGRHLASPDRSRRERRNHPRFELVRRPWGHQAPTPRHAVFTGRSWAAITSSGQVGRRYATTP